MTLELSPKTEALLLREAARQSCDANSYAERLLANALMESEREFQETMNGIERGWRAGEEGRERPLAEYIAEIRLREKQTGNAAG
jgi:hypothetical protein